MTSSSSSRVVVTGLGAITPLGNSVPAFWEAVTAGRSGAGPISRFDATGFPVRIACEVKAFETSPHAPTKGESRKLALFSQYAIAAAREAALDAGFTPGELPAPERAGVYIGCGMGALAVAEEQGAILAAKGPGRVSPFTVPLMIPNMASGNVAIALGAKGPNVCTVTACASGAHAIGDAFRLLQRGEADVVFAGGAESVVTPLSIAGFASARTLSGRNDEPQRASRPFDRDRDGFVMGEGAGVLVLERLEHAEARGARILAEVLGYGLTADAHHMTAPSPDGEGVQRAMRLALADAGLPPEAVGYLNAHGTSTPMNDAVETEAIKAVFGAHARSLPLSSTKSMIGHLLGAAGAVEAVATVLALRDQILPPTINHENPDPACDLDVVPNAARRASFGVAMSNNMGFGGHNASLLFGARP